MEYVEKKMVLLLLPSDNIMSLTYDELIMREMSASIFYDGHLTIVNK